MRTKDNNNINEIREITFKSLKAQKAKTQKPTIKSVYNDLNIDML
jgi:hypothetical protein